MGPRELFPLLIGFLSLFVSTNACDLFWRAKQSLGFDIGIQLQVCCNVSRVRLWPLGQDFSVGEKAIDQPFADPQDDIWAELQLSVCTDRKEPTIGWVSARPGVTCEYKTGQTMTLSPGNIHLPGWYIVCYKMEDGCETCTLETLCSNDLSEICSAITVIGSSPSATNSTINYWTKVGKDFPFPASSSKIELSVLDSRSREVVSTKTIPLKVGSKSDVVLDGLRPNEIYSVRRCLLVQPPASILNDPRFDFPSTPVRICMEEGYRTERSSSSLRTLFLLFFVMCFWSF